jgi:hypothetical protein
MVVSDPGQIRVGASIALLGWWLPKQERKKHEGFVAQISKRSSIGNPRLKAVPLGFGDSA